MADKEQEEMGVEINETESLRQRTRKNSDTTKTSNVIETKVEDSKQKKPPVSRTKALIFVYIAVFIDLFGFTVTIPILPFYAINFGASASQVGLLSAVYAGAQVVATLYMGPLADKLGGRKTLLLSLLGSCIGFLVTAFAWDLNSLYGFRIFAGLTGASAGVANAYITKVTTKEERPRYLALIGAMIGLAFLFGPSTGAGLSEFSLRTPLYVACGLSGFAFLMACVYLREASDYTPAVSQPEQQQQQQPQQLTDDAADDVTSTTAISGEEGQGTPWAAVVLMCLAAFFHNCTWNAWSSFYGVFLEEVFGYGSLEFGFVFTGASAAFVILQVAVYPGCVRRFGLLATGTIGEVLVAAGIGTQALYEDFGLSLISTALLAIGAALVVNVSTTGMSSFTTPSNAGTLLGYTQFASYLGGVVGPLAMGPLFENDIPSSFLIMGLGGGAGFLLVMLVSHFRIGEQLSGKVDLHEQLHETVEQYLKVFGSEVSDIDASPLSEEAQLLAQPLGEFLAKTLEHHNYKLNHSDTAANVKCHLVASFPPLDKMGQDDTATPLRLQQLTNLLTAGLKAQKHYTAHVHS